MWSSKYRSNTRLLVVAHLLKSELQLVVKDDKVSLTLCVHAPKIHLLVLPPHHNAASVKEPKQLISKARKNTEDMFYKSPFVTRQGSMKVAKAESN